MWSFGAGLRAWWGCENDGKVSTANVAYVTQACSHGGTCPPNFAVSRKRFIKTYNKNKNLDPLKIYFPLRLETWLRACVTLCLFDPNAEGHHPLFLFSLQRFARWAAVRTTVSATSLTNASKLVVYCSSKQKLFGFQTAFVKNNRTAARFGIWTSDSWSGRLSRELSSALASWRMTNARWLTLHWLPTAGRVVESLPICFRKWLVIYAGYIALCQFCNRKPCTQSFFSEGADPSGHGAPPPGAASKFAVLWYRPSWPGHNCSGQICVFRAWALPLAKVAGDASLVLRDYETTHSWRLRLGVLPKWSSPDAAQHCTRCAAALCAARSKAGFSNCFLVNINYIRRAKPTPTCWHFISRLSCN